MLIRHLCAGWLTALMVCVIAAFAGCSVWGIVALAILGGNLGILASGMAEALRSSVTDHEFGRAFRPASAFPVSLPPAE
ncbi:hypothetical protein Rumeso_02726 [Rubellimicrobium mesophilum DSM 19309]|uniref:Uncharacterized protein n=1 Tax=Rubellimicrobium mesophilum DSM 19309 TaxID=442562 RepID=A0A017HPF6_9RHOB|nr:hypothetical protein [Rubellimicrobium mesophilum]EYD75639.1 hypothetical protein Rumeso_02726 [Rubellimicrobium mesophilum DSM 19309]